MEQNFCRNLMDKLNNDEDSHFQANSTGSCMGLTISQKLALLLGTEGLIIQSKVDEGTIVSFTIFDQNCDDVRTLTKNALDKHIVIKEPDRIVPHFAAIIDHSKRIEFLRQRNKTLRKRESSYGSFEEAINSAGLTNKRIVEDTNTTALNINLQIHNFESIVRPQIWYSSTKNDYQTSKSPTYKTAKTHTFKESIKEGGFYSAGFRKNEQTVASRKKSAGQQQVFNFQNFQEREDLSQFFSQPLYLGSKSICTTENKISLPKENVECQCEEVLIVDDDAFNLLSLELILKNFNVKCVKAMNGKEAVSLVANKSCSSLKCRGFKMVFMDYQMPIMDGVESTREIIKMYGVREEEEGRHINIIGCTAFTTKKEVENFLKAGLKDIIFKPLNKEIVGNILNEWL